MASAGAPEGTIPNAAATGPGTQNVSGSSGAMSIVDAGLCSKVSSQLPQLLTFFNSTKNALAGITARNQTNSAAISNLQRTQTDFNNQTNFFSFWFRQLSPQVDAASVGLNQANAALADMAQDSTSESSRPGLPGALAVLPGPIAEQVTVYWIAPTYAGMSGSSEPITILRYEILQGSTLITPVGTETTHSSSSTDFGATEFHDMYKGMPVYSHQLSSGAPLQIRAVNNGGVSGSELPGDWTAQTRAVAMVTKQGATVADTDLPPITILGVLPGCDYNLISWRNPHVLQADKTKLPFTGISKWNFGTRNAGDTEDTVVSLTVAQVGAACSIAQIPNSSLMAESTKAYKLHYTTKDAASVEHTSPISTHYDRAYGVNTVPVPRVRISTEVTVTPAVLLRINFSLPDYFTPGAITYTTTVTNATSGDTVVPTIGPATSIAFGATSNMSALGYQAQLVVDVTAYQGKRYTFKVKATDSLKSSVDTVAIGPIPIPTISGGGTVGPPTFTYSFADQSIANKLYVGVLGTPYSTHVALLDTNMNLDVYKVESDGTLTTIRTLSSVDYSVASEQMLSQTVMNADATVIAFYDASGISYWNDIGDTTTESAVFISPRPGVTPAANIALSDNTQISGVEPPTWMFFGDENSTGLVFECVRQSGDGAVTVGTSNTIAFADTTDKINLVCVGRNGSKLYIAFLREDGTVGAIDCDISGPSSAAVHTITSSNTWVSDTKTRMAMSPSGNRFVVYNPETGSPFLATYTRTGDVWSMTTTMVTPDKYLVPPAPISLNPSGTVLFMPAVDKLNSNEPRGNIWHWSTADEEWILQPEFIAITSPSRIVMTSPNDGIAMLPSEPADATAILDVGTRSIA